MGDRVRVINVVERAASSRVVKPGTEAAGGKTWVIDRDPIVAGQNVISHQRILRRPGRAIERIHAKSVARDLYRGQDCVSRGNQGRAVMGERAGVIEIDRRRPANPVEVRHRWRIDGGVLSIAGKRRDAPGWDSRLSDAIASGHQSNKRQTYDQ